MRKFEIAAACIAGTMFTLAGCQAHEGSASTTAAAAPPGAAPQTADATPSSGAPTLRLPDTVRPTAYDVALTVVPTEERFDGRITITVDLRVPSKVVWLNASGLEVRTATVNGAAAKVLPGGSDFIGIQSAQPLPAGRATLVLDYSGAISSKNEYGLFKQKEGADWYSFTQFEPVDARRVFPCFDEPSFKVPWKLRLKVKRQDLAVSNTPAVSEKIEGDYKIVQFAETKPLPSYLVAFAVGPFDAVDAGVVGAKGKKQTPVRIIVPRGRSVEARFAKEVTSQIVNQLEDYFGIPYPYEKLDCLDVPVFSGAMENPGLVTFGQPIILSVPEKETVHFHHMYTDIAAHEFAHQWFGDLVTTSWWDDIWLNEAFATWMTNRLIENWKPERHMATERAADTARAMRDDSLVSARRIREAIVAKDDIANAFDGITYEKGAAVIDMFENWVGRDAFRAGVNRYLTKYAHKNATADQFLAAVFEGERAPVSGAFGTFLNQPGVPLVTASLRCDAGQAPTLALSQERYFPVGSDGKRDASWQIPVCARYPGKKGEATSCTLLSQAQGELALSETSSCPAWVNANGDDHGYYRVHYQGDLLAKLLAPRSGGAVRITPAEKVGLMSDLSALVRTSKVPYDEALAAVPKLASDPITQVTRSTISLVDGLREADLYPESLRAKYARFVRDTYGARAKKLGFVPRAGEDEEVRLLRPRLLALVADHGEDPALQAEAKTLAVRWLQDRQGGKVVDPEVVETVLAIAAATGDRAMFDRMLAAARATSGRFERNQILEAMGHFRDPNVLRAALALTLSDDFDARESIFMLRGAQKTSATREIAYDFLKQNYDALVARLPGDAGAFGFGAWLPEMVGGSFCDESHAADLEGFFHERSAHFTGGPRLLAQTVESVKLCSAYRSLQEPNVTAFLQKR